MINEKLRKAVNDQIKYEFTASYLYMSLSAYFEDQGWEGMAQWAMIQAQEEHVHAMKFYQHLVDRKARIEILDLDKPAFTFDSPLEAFKAAYQHEIDNSKHIYDLGDVAKEVDDRGIIPLLNWFYDEQVEEEKITLEIVRLLEKVGDSIQGLYMVDAKLGARQPEVPAEAEAE